MSDLISRQAAIEAVLKVKIVDEDESLVECPAECNAMIDGAVKELEELPSVQQKQKWISVEERLPEKTGSYLVWMLYSHDETPVHSIINYDSDCEAFGEWDDYYDSVSLGWAGSDFIKIENVYAWMPLPEPPKEETE